MQNTAAQQPNEQEQWAGFFQKRDAGSFEALFRQFYAPLCRYAHSLTGDMAESEELVQQVFVKLWELRNRFDVQISIKSYLYRAVHNQFLSMTRKRKVRLMYEETMKKILPAAEDSQDRQRLAELQKKLESALEKLPEQCRMVFSLSRFEELKYKEIAEVLNLSVKTVENHMGKALRILRAELADYLPLLLTLGLTSWMQ